MQQQDKAVALLLNNRLQGDNSINKLVLAFKSDFDVIQTAGMFNCPTQQHGQIEQVVNVFALAGLRVEMQKQRRARIEELQHPLLIPGHHAIIHALQQPVHLVQMAVGFCQQAVGQQ
ncbi:Uncharacterised protein [Citrobacter werkmanii]|nr:Uncharacterised protein [Citrobacter werkmanii]